MVECDVGRTVGNGVLIDRVPVDRNGLKTGVLEIINTVLVT